MTDVPYRSLILGAALLGIVASFLQVALALAIAALETIALAIGGTAPPDLYLFPELLLGLSLISGVYTLVACILPLTRDESPDWLAGLLGSGAILIVAGGFGLLLDGAGILAMGSGVLLLIALWLVKRPYQWARARRRAVPGTGGREIRGGPSRTSMHYRRIG